MLPPFPDLDPRDLRIDPLARSETIPSAWYTDPRFYDFDLSRVFARTWQLVGHAGRAAEPGDVLTADVAGNPVLVVRGRDGALRAFYNVCRHRGGPLATRDCRVHMLQCRYHGWTYRLDGALRGVPRFDRVDLFDRADYGLTQLPLAEWDGLLFVQLDPPSEPLGTVLDGIAERIAPVRLSGMRFARRVAYDVACNWKVYVDNYLEGYHLPYVHPELCDLLDVGAYVTETHPFYSLQYSPFKDRENLYRAPEGAAYYYFIFPNTMLNILPGRLQTNVVLPLASDRTRVVFDYYYTEIESEEARRKIEEDVAYSDRVQLEDVEICEHVQRGLASRGYDRGRFSVECEEGVYHFQTLLKRHYATAPGPA